MPRIDRFTVSLDTELLAAFDRHIASRGYENRSEAVRDLIRDLLVKGRAVSGTDAVAGILTIVCDHRVGEAMNRVRECLAASVDVVSGSLHIPIDEHRDVLAIALRGTADSVQRIADGLQALRGITHGQLSIVPSET